MPVAHRTGGAAGAAVRAAVADTAALVLLVAVGLLFYRSLLFGGEIGGDRLLMRLVYPYRQFLAEALREGGIPLWNPYLFLGVPFLADPQAGALYPPNLLLRWLDAPAAVAASVVLHATLAGFGTYLFAHRGLGLVRPAAFTAALVYAFGGFLGANAVEPNVVEAAAWLPLVLWGADAALCGRRVAGVAGASAALALQVLAGQPFTSALTWLALLLLLIGRTAHLVLHSGQRRWSVWPPAQSAGRAAAVLVAVGALAAGLAAAQILPSRELAAQSLRDGGLTFEQAAAGAVRPGQIVRALLPGFNEDPARPVVAHLGVVTLGLAVLGLRRRLFGALLGVTLATAGLLIALGDATPIVHLLYRASDGRFAFERPTRALVLVAFGGALAAGAGVHALWPGAMRARRRTRLDRGWSIALALAGVLGLALVMARHSSLDLPSAGVREIWLGLGIIAVDVALVLPLARPRRWLALLLVGAVGAELVVAGAQLPFTRTVPAAAFDAEPALAGLVRAAEQPARLGRVDGVAESDLPPAPGFERYASARAGRDRLAPAAGMLDRVATLEGPRTTLLPPRETAEALGLAGASPVVLGGAGPSRGVAVGPGMNSAVASRDDGLAPPVGALPATGPGALGPRLGVDVLVGPARQTVDAGAVQFTLGVPIVLKPGESARFDLRPEQAATGLALLTALEGALPDGQPAAEALVTEADGSQRRRTLVTGADTADPASAPSGRGILLESGGLAFASEQPLGRPSLYRAVALRNLTQNGVLRVLALALLDERTGASTPLLLDERLRPVAGADPTLYRDLAAPPRAALVRRVQVRPDTHATRLDLASLPDGVVVLDREPPIAIDDRLPSGGRADSAVITAYAPERVEVLVMAAAPAVLVLRDAAYPGWRVRLDGRPASLLRADGLFRAVAVPEGTHSVIFEFRPDSFRRGATISVATATLLIVAVAGSIGGGLARRRGQRGPDEAAAAEQRSEPA